MSAPADTPGRGAPDDAINHHATLILLGDRGVMIAGPSGSGKSALALALLAQCQGAGRFARLVADDQVHLARRGRSLVGYAPSAIAGLIEVRGLGPALVPHEPSALIDLVVELVGAADVPRLQDAATRTIAGIDLPLLLLPARDIVVSSAAILAALAAICPPSAGVASNNMLAGGDDLGLSTSGGKTT